MLAGKNFHSCIFELEVDSWGPIDLRSTSTLYTQIQINHKNMQEATWGIKNDRSFEELQKFSLWSIFSLRPRFFFCRDWSHSTNSEQKLKQVNNLPANNLANCELMETFFYNVSIGFALHICIFTEYSSVPNLKSPPSSPYYPSGSS